MGERSAGPTRMETAERKIGVARQRGRHIWQISEGALARENFDDQLGLLLAMDEIRALEVVPVFQAYGWQIGQLTGMTEPQI